MIDAIVFDFDGLILDTESTSFRAWVETYEEYGCTLVEDDWARHIGTINGFDPVRHALRPRRARCCTAGRRAAGQQARTGGRAGGG